MADHTQHKSLEAQRLYVRNANLFDQQARSGLLVSELRLSKLLAAVENARRSAASRGLCGDAILGSILSNPDVERAFEVAVQERAQDLWFDHVIPDPYAPFDPAITVRQAREDILTAFSDYLQEC